MASKPVGWRCVGIASSGGRMVTCPARGSGPPPYPSMCPKCGRKTVIGVYEEVVLPTPARHATRSADRVEITPVVVPSNSPRVKRPRIRASRKVVASKPKPAPVPTERIGVP